MKEEWIDKVHAITDALEQRANERLAMEIQKATEYREGYVQACEDFGREMRHAVGEKN